MEPMRCAASTTDHRYIASERYSKTGAVCGLWSWCEETRCVSVSPGKGNVDKRLGDVASTITSSGHMVGFCLFFEMARRLLHCADSSSWRRRSWGRLVRATGSLFCCSGGRVRERESQRETMGSVCACACDEPAKRRTMRLEERAVARARGWAVPWIWSLL